ncbi:penicillin-binding protein 1A [Chitinivibrio alkaliphilus]|uniref:Penicillin-binding protein, 1A family n=1 Tax=Chitinivibrio alkaliphilus ACht1 TaxID=1313304 RepID=U7D739_9BACT|nr:PBP1A family penicillin-binding protein [Chitinivibrio alkaliphilus]ERP31763.1 penicillin-binding protein, 1A family [Chitinivibrio alkaliphilus ACht1]
MTSESPLTFTSNKKAPPTDRAAVKDRTVLWIGGAAAILFFLVLGGASAWFFYTSVAETLPEPEQLSNISPSLVTSVYDSEGEVVHEFSIERRFWMPLDSFPEHLVQAVIAIEDARFYEHWGIDIRRIVGAAMANVVQRGYSQGASTLTQQLARNAFLTHDKRIMRKIREILTAIDLERYYIKDEILELYLNMVYMGAGVYGMEAASQQYFSKSVYDLSLHESALLAAAVQRPEAFRPDRDANHTRGFNRRNTVLAAMARNGFISEEDFHHYREQPIEATPAQRTSAQAPYFVEEVRRQVLRMFGEDRLYHQGLSIYTTLDTEAQAVAEEAVTAHLDTLQRIPNRLFITENRAWEMIGVSRDSLFDNFSQLYDEHRDTFEALHDSLKLRQLQTSVVTLDNSSGAVRVLIGGRDFSESRYNRAMQGGRQPGSAFKPFVYTAALKQGYTPATQIIDKPVTIETSEGEWRPVNFDRRFHGEVSLEYAVRRSLNLVVIEVLLDIGATDVISLARRMGISGHLPAVPALAIGAGNVSNLELTRAYSVFPNQGTLRQTYLIDSIVDNHGRVIFRNDLEEQEVLSPDVATVMTKMLEKVVSEGTAGAVRREGFRHPTAGKTGTSNNYSDAWFVGYTPRYTTGVWVGADQRRTMGRGITGSRGAIPIWTPLMQSLHDEASREEFPLTDEVVEHRVCEDTGELATSHCPRRYTTHFLRSNVPDRCTEHGVEQRRDTSNVIDYFGTPPDSRDRDEEEDPSSQMLF